MTGGADDGVGGLARESWGVCGSDSGSWDFVEVKFGKCSQS